jgi:hypothetical protein
MHSYHICLWIRIWISELKRILMRIGFVLEGKTEVWGEESTVWYF